MKILRIAAVVMLLLGATTLVASAQDVSTWIELAPVDELFVARMPASPAVRDDNVGKGPLSVSGKRYTVLADGNSYIVWSFTNPSASGRFHDSSEYLDACADLVWEGLFGPRRAKATKDDAKRQRMTYRSELSNDCLTGREYQILLGDVVGLTQIYVEDSKIYILALLSGNAGTEIPSHFFKSFKINRSVCAAPASDAGSVAGGGQLVSGGPGQDINGNRIFTGREVTQKARVLSKPEPGYTESARKYGVTGTVVMRGVISSDGQLTNIAISRRLPHGLTAQALDAAGRIKFLPAEKDGQPVSMAIQLEYNFNLY